jgi:hypothetical protein
MHPTVRHNIGVIDAVSQLIPVGHEGEHLEPVGRPTLPLVRIDLGDIRLFLTIEVRLNVYCISKETSQQYSTKSLRIHWLQHGNNCRPIAPIAGVC